MIFICVGSREYQFNRLLKKVDELVECGAIKDTVLAQIGQSTYLPKHYRYKRFMEMDEFRTCQLEADLIISHGGTGSLISALKLGKKVLAVPRLARYGEHIDDHQTQIAEMLAKKGHLGTVLCTDSLLNAINSLKNSKPKKYCQPSKVLELIESFINGN